MNDFQSRLRSKEVKEDQSNWMNNKLKFHVDSQRAYDVFKAASYAEAQASAFERYALGGNEKWKYNDTAYSQVKRDNLGDDVIAGAKLEELLDIKEIMDKVTNKRINNLRNESLE